MKIDMTTPDEQVIDAPSRLHNKRCNLDWFPVRPGTVKLKVTGPAMVCEDDGQGALICAGVQVGVINYKSGTVRINTEYTEVLASYKFKSA